MTAYIAPGLAGVDDVVCEYFDVTPEELRSKTRTRRITDARKLAMYVRVTILKEKPFHVGKHYNLDHATAHSSIQVVRDLLQNDKEFKGKAMKVIRHMKGMQYSLNKINCVLLAF